MGAALKNSLIMARKRNKMSQLELAEVSGVSIGVIQKIEAGKNVNYDKDLNARGIKTRFGKAFSTQNVYLVSKVYKKPMGAIRAQVENDRKTAVNAPGSLDKEILAVIIANMEQSIAALKRLL
jgi:hypothetical protein